MGKVAQALAQLGARPVTPVNAAQAVQQQQASLGMIGLGLGKPLPRPDATYDGNFGPMKPIVPMPLDRPRAGQERAEPRLWEYPVGYNLPTSPGDIKLVQFAQLRAFADIYDVARSCIRIRTQEIRDLDWDIVVDQQLVKQQGKDAFKTERETFRAFWTRPQWDYDDLSSWLSAVMELLLTIDALGLYPAPSKSARGRTGSGIAEVQIIDGATIKPLIDVRGGRPRPPAPAYQQYLWGIPRVDLVQASGMTSEELFREAKLGNEYRADQLLYLRKHVRVNSPYGMSPLEQSIVNTMIALRRQEWLSKYFEQGSLPMMFIQAPADWSTEQMAEYEQMLNDVGSSDIGQRHQMRVIPKDANPTPAKDAVLSSELDKFLLEKTCAAFDVTPAELGFAPNGGLGGKGFADAQENVQFRKALLPDKQFLERQLTRISREFLGMPAALEFKFLGFDAKEDAATQATIDAAQIESGQKTIDEIREAQGLPAWGFPLTAKPFYVTRQGLTPLDPDMLPPAPTPAEAAQPNAMPDADPNTQGVQAAPPPNDDNEPDDEPPSARAKLDEAKALKKFMERRDWRPGRPFEGKALSPSLIAQASDGPEAYSRVLTHIEKTASAEDDTKRREAELALLIAASLKRGDTKRALTLLREAYTLAYQTGAAYWDGTTPLPLDNTPATLAESQRQYITALQDEQTTSDLSDAMLASRAAGIASTLWGVYQAGKHRYAPDGTYWRWETSAGGHVCDHCAARNGSVFTDADLPGYPGSGGYGSDLCSGGPRCRCDLVPITRAEYERAKG